ncbi:MAG: glycosyltransferase family 25 protein [Gammaproteobacteria bacterium]|nr:glycosyltransferase family 25 protein [Gammaproteobacteria bacterium]
MKSFVINLDSKTDRWNTTQERFKQVHQDVERWPAVCQDNRQTDLDHYVHPTQSSFSTPAVINTALSHVTLWSKLAKGKDNHYLICEDDAQPVSDFQEKLTRVLDQVPSDWDVLLLGRQEFGDAFEKIAEAFIRIQRQITREQKDINDLIEIPSSFSGLYGYMVSKKGAIKLCEFIEDYKIRMHIDIQMNMIPGLKLYATRETLLHHDFTLGSSIASGRPSFVTGPLNTFHTGAAPLGWALTQPIFALGGTPVNSLSIGYLVLGFVLSLCTLRMEVVVRFRLHGLLIFLLLMALLMDTLYHERDMHHDLPSTMLDTTIFSMGVGLPWMSKILDRK